MVAYRTHEISGLFWDLCTILRHLDMTSLSEVDRWLRECCYYQVIDACVKGHR